jgi:transposase
MQAGENVSVLARELGVSRKSIYQWRNRYRLGGGNALRDRGRTTKAERAAHEEALTAEKQAAKEARQASLEELARAQRRIAALERKIGQQQVEPSCTREKANRRFRS